MSHMNKSTRPRISHQSARRPRPRRPRPAHSHPLKDAVPARSAGRRTLHRLVRSVHGRPASTHALRAGGDRAADPRALAGVRARPPRGRRHPRGELLDRDPAAERHRRAAHGPRAELDDPGRPHPHEPHARPAREVDLRHRPRRHRHAAPGREAARDRGHVARRARPRALPGARVGMARALRRRDHRAGQAPGRDARLRGRALHDGRALRPGGAEGLRRALRAGPDLPRPLHGQLGSGPALGDLRPRGRGARGRRRHAVLDRLPAGLRRRGARGGDGAPGDDARRHRRRGAPRRRALRAPRRPGGHAAARRPPPADHRRRVRQDRLRHRRAEDHARATTPTTSRSAAATAWRRSASSARTA